MSRPLRILSALGLALVWGWTPLAALDVINVPADKPTIQSAIASAQNGDLILVAPGTYNEQIDYLGKAVSVIGTGGAAVTTIDASGLLGWNDIPYDAIVRFINGEGPGSVLQGFTLTGHNDPTSQSAPVWSTGTPTLVGCTITGNTGWQTGGFFGGGTLSGCVIDNNFSNQEGGGVSGDTQLFDCIISNNRSGSYNGGGLHTDGGMMAVRCTIIDNSSAGDAHSGGGVDGPAVLIDCLIARNMADEFAGQNMYGASAVDGAALISGCTIVENVFIGNGGYVVKDIGTIVDSIIWNNTQVLGEIDDNLADYSLVEGGATGIGNLNQDPLFVDPSQDDFSLQRSSPCLDAGDPNSPPDPDGTRRDMGAFFIPQFQASWAFRYGTGFSQDYLPSTDPEIGSNFQATLTGSLTTTTTTIVAYALPSSPVSTPFGELLVDPTSTFMGSDTVLAILGTGTHAIAIPNDPNLIGTTAATQGVLLGGGVVLTNAIDLVLGL